MKPTLNVQQRVTLDELLTPIPCQYTRMAMMGIASRKIDKVITLIEQSETKFLEITNFIHNFCYYEKPTEKFWNEVLHWLKYKAWNEKATLPFPQYPKYLLSSNIDPSNPMIFNIQTGRIKNKKP